MFSAGIMIVPSESADELVAITRAAEEAGFDFCLIADEGFTYDVYVLMSRVVVETSRLRVAPITNPYSRHPAVTAVALASVDALAPGRVFLSVVPGGSLVLRPMSLPATKPVTACREMIQIIRALQSGKKSDLEGKVFGLSGAELRFPARPMEIWVMGRGPRMLHLSGEMADVTVVTGHMGVDSVFELLAAGAASAGRELRLAYLGRMAFSQEIVDNMRPHFTYVLPDSPSEVWARIGRSVEWIAELRRVREEEGAEAASAMITDDILGQLTVSGTPEQCVDSVCGLVRDRGYEHFILPVMSLNPDYALPLMEQSVRVYESARRKLKEERDAKESQ